ncbi:MAG: NAD(P)H-binding protein [Rhizobiales bacterium]|nr:NAD(P)H-binding protein [Hyphomicrobiales bacterium]
MRIFLAGASGAIGRRLTPLLLAAGHEVTGSTRSAETARQLNAAGMHGAVVDVFDAAGMRDAVVNARLCRSRKPVPNSASTQASGSRRSA